MALVNQVDLKLVLTAQNEALAFFDEVRTAVNGLRESLLSLNDIDPFAELTKTAADATAQIQQDTERIREYFNNLRDMNPFSNLAAQATAAADEAKAAIVNALTFEAPNPFAAWDIPALQEQVASLKSEIMGITGGGGGRLALGAGSATGTTSGGIPTSAAMRSWFMGLNPQEMTAEQRAAYLSSAMGRNPTAQEIKDFYSKYGMDLGAPVATVEGSSALKGLGGKTAKGLGMSDIMNAGMQGMMAYYGLQMVTNSAKNMAYVQQMMKLNNETPNEAARSMLMLSAGGMTGSGATSYLQGLAGRMQTLFTPQIGTGMLSKNAILLQSLGITQQSITQSPWMLLNQIGSQYQHFIGAGQGNKASQLLQLTGTGNMQVAFQNWNALQKSASSFSLGMTPSQVQSATKSSLTLEQNIAKLGLEFSKASAEVAPFINVVARAVTTFLSRFNKIVATLDAAKTLIESWASKTAGEFKKWASGAIKEIDSWASGALSSIKSLGSKLVKEIEGWNFAKAVSMVGQKLLKDIEGWNFTKTISTIGTQIGSAISNWWKNDIEPALQHLLHPFGNGSTSSGSGNPHKPPTSIGGLPLGNTGSSTPPSLTNNPVVKRHGISPSKAGAAVQAAQLATHPTVTNAVTNALKSHSLANFHLGAIPTGGFVMSGGGRGSTVNHNINVNINANTSSTKDLAKHVANEIVNKMNIRGPYDVAF